MQRDYILYRDQLKIEIADCYSKIETDIFRKQNVDFTNKIRTHYNHSIGTIDVKNLVDDESPQTHKLMEQFKLFHANAYGRNAADVIKNNENLKENDAARINAAAEALNAKRHAHTPVHIPEVDDETKQYEEFKKWKESMKDDMYL